MLIMLNHYIRNSHRSIDYQPKHIEIRENLNMKHYATLLLSLLLISLTTHLPAALGAEINPKVAAALAWEVPPNECGQQPALAKGGSDRDENVSGFEVQRTYGLDSNTLNRYKRRQNRWLKCMTKYNQGIVDSIETLRNSAQYGLTESQAKIIYQKMVDAQAVLTAQRPASR